MKNQQGMRERSGKIVEKKTYEKGNKETLEERGTQVSKATVEGQECSRLDNTDSPINHRF